MSASTRTRSTARCTAVLLGVALVLAASPALANPGAAVSIAPNFPATTSVGDMFTAELSLYNTSDADVPELTVDHIHLNASCLDKNHPCLQPNGTVFSLAAFGDGSQACAGVTFTIVSQSGDLYLFTPDATVTLDRVVVGGQPCVISFDVSTIAVPTSDAAPTVAGLQVFQVGHVEAQGFSDVLNVIEIAEAIGTDTTTVQFNPAIDVTKDCEDVIGADGEITFSGTITNTGDVPLTNVTLVDSHAGAIALPQTTLAIGESIAYSGSYLPPNGDPIENTVTASGFYDFGGAFETEVTDVASDICEQLIPSVLVDKDCVSRELGTETNAIDITVTNTGEVELTGCVVTDPLAGYTSDPFTLAVGASADFDTAVSSIGEDTLNEVSVTCDVTGAAFQVSDTDEDLCEVPICEVSVDKQVSCDGGQTWNDVGYGDSVIDSCDVVEGDQVQVRYLASSGASTGPLVGCTLTDSNVGIFADAQSVPDIAVGFNGQILTTQVLECSDALEQGEPDTATLQCECFDDTTEFFVNDSDQASFACLQPALEVAKDCIEQPLGSDTSEIEITVTNAGEVALEGCVATDTLAGYTSDPFDLAIGADTVLNTSVALDAETLNEVSVTCGVAGSAQELTEVAEDVCEVPICEVMVDKQVSCDGGQTWNDVGYGDSVIDSCDVVEGDQVQVRYYASSGDSTGALVNCSLTDSNLGIFADAQSVPDIAVGFDGQILTTQVLECSDALEEGEPDTATLECECFDDTTEFFVNDSDQASFACLQPALEVAKDCVEQPLDSDTSEIEITVTNAGEVALEGCVATDTLAGYTSDPFDLAIGADTVLNTSVALDEETLNEVSVTCGVAGSAQELTEVAEDVCEVPICEVFVDKQISCDGGQTWVDMGYEDGAVESCDVIGGENVWVRYLASTGASTSGLVNCTLNETNVNIFGSDQVVGPLAAGFDGEILQTQVLECSEDLELGEPDTATLECECFDDTTEFFVSDSDQAAFTCQQADFTVAKSCVPEAVVNGETGFVDVVEITVENTGEIGLDCNLVDTLYAGDATCPPAGEGTELFTTDFSIAAGETMVFDSDAYPALATGELTADACNQVVVECTPVGAAEALPPQTAEDVCEFVDCQVELDKQVSCNGGTDWFDVGFDDDVAEACIGWTDFEGGDASEVLVRYIASNTGNVELAECTISESNSLLSGGVMDPFTLAVGGGEFEWTLTPGVMCSEDLAAGEPDTAMINCLCGDFGPDAVVTDDDSADFECQTPALQVSKVCDEEMDDMNQVHITVSNVGEFDLADCQVVDTIYLDDPSCPADVGAGTPVDDFLVGYLAAGESTELSTSWSDLMADACNTVTVECDIVGAGGATITATADDVCEAAAGCLTRTGGFWGTHPHIAEYFLPVDSCGLTLDNTLAWTNGSTAEDICISGQDAKGADTTMQQLQLIRQCTVAQLNIAATMELEGNCYADYPGLTTRIDECCSQICTGEMSGSAIGASGCIEWLDAFNNSEDTLDAYGTMFESPGPAQPEECQEARGNGFVNDRPLGPAQGGSNGGGGNPRSGPRMIRTK